ncbi:MAG TPA: condensation domain-containing protein, partial [Candidatus Deferrimicrobium sp.]|nr:condensation domain-containing protein [Candidatus Deferrimicrobium sp.]
MLNENDKKVLLFRSRFLKQKDYWIKKLSGEFETTDILFDFDTIHPIETGEGRIEISFPIPLGTQIMKLSKNSDLSIYIFLLAALKTLIFRYTASEDIITISPINTLKITAETINTILFIRDRLESHMTFKEVVLNVRQSVLEAYENQDYPFDTLLEYLFTSAEAQNQRAVSNIRCSMGSIHDDRNIEKINAGLSFHFVRDEDRLKGYVLYEPLSCKKTGILQFLGHFINLLAEVVANIDCGISGISFLTEQEKKHLLAYFNDNKEGPPDAKTIVHLIEEQVERVPDNT